MSSVEGQGALLRAQPNDSEERPAAETTARRTVSEAPPLDLIETSDPGVVLAIGDLSLLDATVTRLTFDPKRRDKSLGDVAALATGAANAAAQLANGMTATTGLVRLAPETLAAMKAGAQPLTSGGWNLGSLAQGGKVSHAVRWAPAGSQAAVGVLAALGPAAALMAIQFQLAKISTLVKENIAITRSVLRSLKVDQWAVAKAHYESLATELEHAKAVGKVTQTIWGHVQAQGSETELRRQLDAALHDARNLADLLIQAKTAGQRKKWLEDHSETLLRTTQTLLMAEHGWMLYQALRAASLQDAAQVDASEALLQRRIVEAARERHDEVTALVTPLLTRAYRYLKLIEKNAGSLGIKLFGREATRKDVTEAATHLASQLAALLEGTKEFDPNPPPPKVAIPLVERAAASKLTEQLRWVLETGEDVVSLIEAKGSRYLIFTSHRVLVVDLDDFLASGEIEREIVRRSLRSLSKVSGSDRDDGFDLALEYAGPSGKATKQTYTLRGSALSHQGDGALTLLEGLVPASRDKAVRVGATAALANT